MANVIDTDQLSKLSPERRLQLISQIWNSLIEEGVTPTLDEESLSEAERRINELKANPEMGISMEEMRKRRGWSA